MARMIFISFKDLSSLNFVENLFIVKCQIVVTIDLSGNEPARFIYLDSTFK